MSLLCLPDFSSDLVAECWFDLANESHWKAMSADAIESLGPCLRAAPPLLPCDINAVARSIDLERALRACVEDVCLLDLSAKFDCAAALRSRARHHLGRQSLAASVCCSSCIRE